MVPFLQQLLWKYNWPIINCTYLKNNSVYFNICTHPGNHHHDPDNEHIHYPEEFLMPLGNISLPSPYPPSIPRQPLVCLMSLWFNLHILEFYIHGVIQHVVSFWSDFFHLAWWFWGSPMLLYVSIVHIFLLLNTILPMDRPQFVYPFTCWWTFGLFPILDYYK